MFKPEYDAFGRYFHCEDLWVTTATTQAQLKDAGISTGLDRLRVHYFELKRSIIDGIWHQSRNIYDN